MRIFPSTDHPEELIRRFNPGHWIDRRDLVLPRCIVISGLYEREHPRSGVFHSETLHYYRLSITDKPESAQCSFIDSYPGLQPQGEITLVPAGSRYHAETGRCRRRSLFVFIDSRLDNQHTPLPTYFVPPDRIQDFTSLRHERIRAILIQIYRELYSDSLASSLMIEGLATTLLVETARYLDQQYGLEKSARGGLSPTSLRKIKERIHSGAPPPSVAELAQLCELSERHLMRAFKETTGQTVGQYLNQVILEEAMRLLRNTDCPIGSIATQLGFSSTSSFSTAFRRFTEESPRTFRARESGCEIEEQIHPSSRT